MEIWKKLTHFIEFGLLFYVIFFSFFFSPIVCLENTQEANNDIFLKYEIQIDLLLFQNNTVINPLDNQPVIKGNFIIKTDPLNKNRVKMSLTFANYSFSSDSLVERTNQSLKIKYFNQDTFSIYIFPINELENSKILFNQNSTITPSQQFATKSGSTAVVSVNNNGLQKISTYKTNSIFHDDKLESIYYIDLDTGIILEIHNYFFDPILLFYWNIAFISGDLTLIETNINLGSAVSSISIFQLIVFVGIIIIFIPSFLITYKTLRNKNFKGQKTHGKRYRTRNNHKKIQRRRSS
ncbi:MAG: hypothetical protein ACTSWL_06400 [Promethearchaeota archaeon]